MEHLVWQTVLGLTAMLAVAVLLVPLANRLHFPYTVLLAAVGVTLGLLIQVADTEKLGVLGDVLYAFQEFKISSDAVFFIFLPVLVFESSLSIDVRRLMDDIGPILFLAIVGLLISTVAIGFSMNAVSSVGLLACLLLGTICSATDPVAVVAIFKDLGVPKRLAILVEGESLFNDATAIVLFTILAAMLAGTGDSSLLSGTVDFLRVFAGGVIIGYLMARVLCAILARLQDLPLVETTLTVSLAYLSFIVAEHYLQVSGVMAVVTAALVMGSRGRTAISPGTWRFMGETWEQLGFWANSIIFILVGLAVPHLLAGWDAHSGMLLALLIIVAFVARAAIIYGLLPLMSAAGLAQPVSTGYRAVMWWGGLRGAVSLALALAVLESPAFSSEVKQFIGMLVTGFVLFTLFVNATTVRFILRFFGLDKLSPTDMAMRDRAMCEALGGIGEKIERLGTVQGMESEAAQEASENYSNRAREARNAAAGHALSDEEWLRVGLRVTANQERKSYLQFFSDAVVSMEVTRALLAHVEDVQDSVKARGTEGYRDTVDRHLGFSTRFRIALDTQHHVGWQAPLAKELAQRFEVLIATTLTLAALLEENWTTATSLLPETTALQVRDIIRERLTKTERALDALKLQYPAYAEAVHLRDLGIVGMRLEEKSYGRMLSEAIISQEGYKDLMGGLAARRSALDHRPKLDLGLDASSLIDKVPFLADLDPELKKRCARLMRAQLALPGEKIISMGDKGHAFYFISSGAVQVEIPNHPIQLGSGQFFGEIALVSDRPRNANVVAQCYCQLLALYRDDFQIVLRQNPELKKTIEEIADQRARETRQLSGED